MAEDLKRIWEGTVGDQTSKPESLKNQSPQLILTRRPATEDLGKIWEREPVTQVSQPGNSDSPSTD